MAETAKKDVLQPTDADSIRLARTLLRSARHGALATIDAGSGAPLATRVATATDIDGTPLILVSALSAHTAALKADPRCSLLLGEPGKGDPLAHPRISIACRADLVGRDDTRYAALRRRYLNRHPKAELYVDFPDFSIFRLVPTSASLNGGFARAYALSPEHLLADAAVSRQLAESEQRAIDHMNADHADALSLYACHFAGLEDDNWKLTGIDPDGIDLARGDKVCRIFFPQPLNAAAEVRTVLVAMAKESRQAG